MVTSTENSKEKSFFRDRLTTVSEEGKRIWVYPKKPKGKLYNYRRLFAFFFLAFFIIMPFIKYKGDPILLLDILERKFIVFGMIIWPQDFHLVVLSLIAFVVFIILFTVIFGRLFCGWACPQTIFMEMVFRPIEYMIEGDYHQQKRLNKQKWNFEKIWKKTLKHLIFYGLAFFFAHIFFSCLKGWEYVRQMIIEGPISHIGIFAPIVIFSGVFYFIYAFFREQVCTIVCPYGRLQGVFLDNNSIIVAYDYKRGEPRGHVKQSDMQDVVQGDCIDCNACVVVCPTNIDIRNGTQLECINCNACIDACNAVMDRINKQRGLIRYDSEKGISEGKSKIFTARSIAYSVLLAILLFIAVFAFSKRTDFEANILRLRGTLYQEYGEDKYINLFQLEVVNKTREVHKVRIELDKVEGEIKYLGDPIEITKGEVKKVTFLVILDKKQLESSNHKFGFKVYSKTSLIKEINATFLGPKTLDK